VVPHLRPPRRSPRGATRAALHPSALAAAPSHTFLGRVAAGAGRQHGHAARRMAVAGPLLSSPRDLVAQAAASRRPPVRAAWSPTVRPLRLWRRRPVSGLAHGVERIFFSSICPFLWLCRHQRRLTKSLELGPRWPDPVSARLDPKLWLLDLARASRTSDDCGWPRRRRWRQLGVSAPVLTVLTPPGQGWRP